MLLNRYRWSNPCNYRLHGTIESTLKSVNLIDRSTSSIYIYIYIYISVAILAQVLATVLGRFRLDIGAARLDFVPPAVFFSSCFPRSHHYPLVLSQLRLYHYAYDYCTTESLGSGLGIGSCSQSLQRHHGSSWCRWPRRSTWSCLW